MADGGSKPLRVLLVSGDMPSHLIAVGKLALWLVDAGHDVTYAVPGEAPVAAALKEVRGSPVKVTQVGRTAVVKQANVHGSIDSLSWQAFIDQVRKPMMYAAEEMQTQMAPIYEPIVKLIEQLQPDILVHNHAVYSPAGDAAEKFGLPVVSFMHLPYDPCLFMGYETTWHYPRMVPFFPHVATYSATAEQSLYRRCWQRLDSYLSQRAWATSSRSMQWLRQKRGLPPAPNDFASYHTRHPSGVLGGPPFGPPTPVPPLTAVVGDVEREPAPLPVHLAAWLEAAGPQGVVFVSMGTGQTLSPEEARQVAHGLGREIAAGGIHEAQVPALRGPRLLWALRKKQQEELKHVLVEELGEPELQSAEDPDAPPSMLFLGGVVRVEHFAPQYSLLRSGRVKLFLSHMGFGAFTEAVQSGVPMMGYPGGWDQEHNMARALDAGLGVRAPLGLVGLEATARKALANDELLSAATRAQRQLQACGRGGVAAVKHIEHFARMSREEAAALRPAMASEAARDPPLLGKRSDAADVLTKPLRLASVTLGAIVLVGTFCCSLGMGEGGFTGVAGHPFTLGLTA